MPTEGNNVNCLNIKVTYKVRNIYESDSPDCCLLIKILIVKLHIIDNIEILTPYFRLLIELKHHDIVLHEIKALFSY